MAAKRTVDAAKSLLALAAPEAAVPLAALGAIGGGRKAPRHHLVPEDASTVTFEAPLIVLRKGSIKRKRVGGHEVLVVTQPKGLKGTEAVLLLALGGTAYAAYRLSKDVSSFESKIPKLPSLPSISLPSLSKL